MPLAGWLSAGYVMLIDGMDSLWRSLVDGVAAADSWEAVDLAFEALKAESSYRRRQHDEVDAKRRAATGGPSHFRSLSSEQLDSAVQDVASWAGVSQQKPDEAGE